MLYPKTAIDVNQPVNELPSGHIGLLPLTLEAGQTISISLKQIITNPQNLPQDRSLRAWISEQPGGRSLTESTNITAAHLTALNTTVIRVLAPGAAPETDGFNIPALPGQYWLNVLNLVNEANSFAIVIEQ